MIDPVGAVLAGGAGRRIGGSKALVELAGRPLIAWPLGVLRQVLGEVVVVAKHANPLPPLEGVEVWEEPAAPRHPAIGMVAALRRAGGRPVLVVACDMPLLDASTVELIARAPGEAPAVVASVAGELQPLLGRYGPQLLETLERGGQRGEALRELVASLSPVALEVGEEAVFNVNTPEDLARAEEILGRRR
jgi:molybdopterin-guanine dinucleotide biosynthesis protein A